MRSIAVSRRVGDITITVFALGCECQSAKSHYYAIAPKCDLVQAPMMGDWSSDEARRAIRRFMDGRDLNVLNWTARAKMPESTLRNFLNGAPQATITLKSLERLARAENVDVAVLLGLAPDLTPNQLRAAEIAGQLATDDLAMWFHFGTKVIPKPEGAEPSPAVAPQKRPKGRHPER